MKPSAILATDLDGTLLRADQSISALTRQALDIARDSNVDVVFVTGRPPVMLSTIADLTGHTGTVISANGAITLDMATMQPLSLSTFNHDTVRALLAELTGVLPDAQLRAMMHKPWQDTIRDIGYGVDFHQQVAQRLETGWSVFKLAVYVDDPALTSADVIASLPEHLGTWTDISYSTHQPALVELAPSGVHKGVALSAYAQRVGVEQADVHAVGDMPNDLPMLDWAGRSYAVANAHPDVLTTVDEIVPSNEEDGVAHLLTSLMTRHAES